MNNVMLTLTGVCALVTVSTLVSDSGYLVYNGGKSVDLDFFTKLPLPPGEIGGGMANAIVGSAADCCCSLPLIGIPIGFLRGRLSGGVRRQDVRVPGSLYGRSAEWRAVDRDRHFRLDRRGRAHACISRRSPAAFALSMMLIPIAARSTEQFLRECRARAGRRAGAGREQVADDRHCGGAGRAQGHS